MQWTTTAFTRFEATGNANPNNATAYFVLQPDSFTGSDSAFMTRWSGDASLSFSPGGSGQFGYSFMNSSDAIFNDSYYSPSPSISTSPLGEPVMLSYQRQSGNSILSEKLYRSRSVQTQQVGTVDIGSTARGIPLEYFGSTDTAIGNNSTYFTRNSGKVGEIIYYSGTNGVKNAADQAKIESYLAMKYGFTLRTTAGAGQDYKNSSNTTVWNATTAGTTYMNRIGFIAQDATSGLTKSTMAIVDTTNQILVIKNASDLEDLEFAAVGDNNAQKTTPISSNSPASFQQRLSRSWLYQTTGGDGVGTVNLEFNLNNQTALPTNGAASTYKLLTDTDDDFTAGAVVSNIVPTVSAGVVTFAAVPMSVLTNGTRIAIGQPGAALTYSASTWTETTANAGAIDQTTPITITLTGDTFPAAVTNGSNLTAGTHYSLTNLPAGLTFNLRKDSSTQLTAVITGAASSHLNANDVANFGITFANAAFTTASLAAYVVDYNKSNLIFNFFDPNSATIEFSAASAASTNEATANNFPKILVNGTLSSAQSVDVIVSGGTASPYGVDYTFGTLNILSITIPVGSYDGTAGTAITITAPTLNNDIAGEGGETIILGFANLSGALTV
jgi:hypothetical protein